MQATFELLGAALFGMLIVVQLGMVMMIGIARLFRSLGVFKEGEKEEGWRGFLKGFS